MDGIDTSPTGSEMFFHPSSAGQSTGVLGESTNPKQEIPLMSGPIYNISPQAQAPCTLLAPVTLAEREVT